MEQVDATSSEKVGFFKRVIRKYLGIWALPEHSYTEMVQRHDREIKMLQSHCLHKKLSFGCIPFAVCTDCQKVVRMATEEEQAQEIKQTWDRTYAGIEEAELKFLEHAPMAVGGFCPTQGGNGE